MRTILFGLDGATYTVLDHLVSLGVMPNLERFMREGTRSSLTSTPMPITPQAWTSLATGRSAGHHGVHDFVRAEMRDQGVFFRLNDSAAIHTETLWKYASRTGRRATVLNYYGVAPPEEINGHTMPGFVSGRHLRRSSYPADLFERLKSVEAFDVKILGMDQDIEKQCLKEMDAGLWCEWIDHHIQREQAWFGVLKHLMQNEPSDLTAIVLDGVDKIQHLAYRFVDPALIPDPPSEWQQQVIDRCRTYFKQVDDFLGEVIDLVGPWGRVFIASDHGFTATTELVYINKWLHDEGYLHWRGEVAADEDESIFAHRLTEHVELIDWTRTTAYALTPSCNGIYLNVPDEQRAALCEEITAKLFQIRAADGEQVITEVKRRDEWFAGPYMRRVPDLTLTLRDFGLVSVMNSDDVVVPRSEPAGTHHPDGILLGRGPGIPAGATVETRNILDVTPLLAHSIGLTIPAEYEGVFPASFYDPAYLASDPARIAQRSKPNAAAATRCDASAPVAPAAPAPAADMDAAEEEAVMARLRSLGYIE